MLIPKAIAPSHAAHLQPQRGVARFILLLLPSPYRSYFSPSAKQTSLKGIEKKNCYVLLLLTLFMIRNCLFSITFIKTLLAGITDGTQVHNITSSSPYPCAVCLKRHTEVAISNKTQIREENRHCLCYLLKPHFECHSPVWSLTCTLILTVLYHSHQ